MATGAILLASLGLFSGRLALADYLRQKPDLEAIRRSVHLNPFNPEGFRAKALHEELQGKNSSQSWRMACQLNPRDPRLLIPAGIQAEIAGDLASAEYYFKTAEKTNRLWLPRWTLANFYARRGDSSQALFWIKSALERSYGQTQAAFQLALDVGISEPVIAEQVLPDNAHSYGQFLLFLASQPATGDRARLLESSGRRYVALSVQARPSARDGQPLLVAINRLLEDGYGLPARRLWDLGCEKAFIDEAPGSKDSPIVNGSLSRRFLGQALDWKLIEQEGVISVHHPGSGTVKYAFSGDQPDHLKLLVQTLALTPNQAWRVHFDYRTEGIAPRQATFAWVLGEEPLSITGGFASESWATSSFLLPAANGERVTNLILTWHRQTGVTRPQGELWIRNLQAERLP